MSHSCSLWLQKMADKCFRKCINYPGSELDTRETVSEVAVCPVTWQLCSVASNSKMSLKYYIDVSGYSLN